MGFSYPIQANFSRGELNPRLLGRIDLEYYKMALKTCTNWTILRQGGLRRRSGFQMVKEVADSTKKVNLIPFVFGTPSNGVPQAYALEFGNLYMRVYVNGALVTSGGGVPTAIMKANPAVVTLNAHGFANGDKIYVTGIGGMVELNNREFTVSGVTANTFQLSGVDSSAYTAFTSGGLAKKIYQLATPYLEADLPLLDYTQSADTLTVTHVGYQPQEISRTADASWTITPIVFKDGPYLEEPVGNTNGVTPSITNAINPLMTSNTTPSGVASGGSTPYVVFDYRKDSPDRILGGGTAYWQYAPAAPVVANNYQVSGDSFYSGVSPAAWDFQGFDGTNWVTLDSQQNQISWGNSETRSFSFLNSTAFQAYRLNSLAPNGGQIGGFGYTSIAELSIGYNGDYAPTMTLTFDTTANINSGAGFTSNDVARNIRLMGKDGKWRYFVITGVTNTTTVTGRMYGYALPDLTKIVRWKLGAFWNGNWPSKCGFFQSRRVFAKTPLEPYSVWLTKTFDFYDMGVSQPLVDDDAIRLKMLTGRVNGVRWLVDAENLSIGTTDNVRVITRSNTQLGFGATNVQTITRSQVGSAEIRPVSIQQTILFADYYGKMIREFIFDSGSNGYIAADVTILGDHLLQSTIVDMAYQKSPDSIVWVVTGNGSLVAMTYDREQNIVGLTNCPVAGGDAGTGGSVESICTIPSTIQDEIYIVVKRTIGGVIKRYIEKLSATFENMPLAQANFLDSSMTYSGSPASVISGLSHLAGQTVKALADGMVFAGLVVSATGTVSLPAAASTVTVGLQYTSTADTLALAQISQDGVHLGRKAQAGELYFNVMDSLGLKVKGLTSIDAYDVFRRDTTIDPISGPMVPRNGVTLPIRMDTSWRQNGQFRFYVDDPLPCTVLAMVIGAAGEP